MKRRPLVLIAFFFIAAAVAALLFIPGRTLSVPKSASLSQDDMRSEATVPVPAPPAVNTITGLPCPSGNPTRPMGVMLAGDIVVRPLSGIASADLVVEMPVITKNINRFLALYACSGSFDIGSVRSARDDFIPLVAAFDAIYGHWGGSHFALDELKLGVIDDLDALKNPYGAYFRKRGILSPHNGFTTLERLWGAAEKLGYRTMAHEEVFPHLENAQQPAEASASSLVIAYPGPFRVQWQYDSQKKAYLRSRGGTTEKDKNNGVQVTAATIVVMRTAVRQIEGQYNDVRVTGSGDATVYRFGQAVAGSWEKDEKPISAPIRFVDGAGNPIPFAKGPVWLEIVQQDTVVTATSQ